MGAVPGDIWIRESIFIFDFDGYVFIPMGAKMVVSFPWGITALPGVVPGGVFDSDSVGGVLVRGGVVGVLDEGLADMASWLTGSSTAALTP